MRSFADICDEAERETQEEIGKEVKNFHVTIFKNWFQAVMSTIGYWFACRFKRLSFIRSRLRRKNEVWLYTIRKYRPLVKEAYGLVQTFFDQWEAENRRYGCGSKKASQMEEDARRLVETFTSEAQGELANAYYPYASLRFDLIRGSSGWITVEKGILYWDGLERFFAKRVENLS